MAKEMNTEARAARREYMRRWRSEHPESVKAAQARYWAKKAESMKNRKDDTTCRNMQINAAETIG